MQDWKQNAMDAKLNLENFVDSLDCESLLIIMIGYLSFANPEEQIGDKLGLHPVMIEKLAKFTIPRFNNSPKNTISPNTIFECYDLLEQFVKLDIFPDEEKLSLDDLNNIEQSLYMDSEVIRGNAYPEQTKERIDNIQGKFDKWFGEKTGICPSKVTETIINIYENIEKSFNSFLKKVYENLDDYKNKARAIYDFKNEDELNLFAFTSALISGLPEILPQNLCKFSLDDEEVKALKELIGVSRDSWDNTILIQKKPMYILSNGCVLFSDLSNLLDTVWEKFDLLAKSDSKFYQRYQKHRSSYLEQQAVSTLKRIFPSDCIFENLIYPDPDKINGSTELDIAVKWGPFLILIEAKSKQFRFESQKGNKKTLKSDIIDNVVEAYSQNLRTIKYIESTEIAELKERDSEKRLTFSTNDIKKIYPISLSLFHLADLGTELTKLKELGLFIDNKYPFSICLSDLDLILRANIFPESFLHYIERRLNILSSKVEWNGDELSLFSMYLESRLLLSNLSGKDDKQPTIIYSSSSDKFDELILYERGRLTALPDLSLTLPPLIKKIIWEFSQYNDDSAKWITFSLLELDNALLQKISEGIENLKKQKHFSAGKIKRCVITGKNIAISLIATNALSIQELERQNQAITVIEKYRNKSEICIGLAMQCNDNRLIINTATFLSFPWEVDLETQKLIDDHFNNKSTKKSKKIGRNSLCPCGSGKKFKKCCLNNS
ncbi:TPA: SEC-C domain-containing protein [Legionella pneumophila]|nr:SEC-C domain-containing protein [Legionella pneumophila]